MNTDFFNDIPEIKQFAQALDERSFIPVPDNWIIVVADVKDSTGAISDGRYKDVNMIGGAVICAVQNATGDHNWPFVFGGDGATLAVHEDAKPAVQEALVRTRSLASSAFNLDLRIGFVPVSDIRTRGADLLVARHQVSPGNSFALFGGGGIELAEALIKDDTNGETYSVPDYSLPGPPDLSGLSCRWQPLNSRKGSILCLLVKPRTEDFQQRQHILSTFLSDLTQELGTALDQANPIESKSLRFTWPPKGLFLEVQATRANKSSFRRLLEVGLSSFIQWFLERTGLTMAHYDGQHYRDELATNSDYCKFDDVLRMVLDCSLEQVPIVRKLLENMRNRSLIDYGFFESDSALITCLLYDLESSHHLHFVDGSNGGLCAASVQLKQQLAQLDSSSDGESISSELAN